MQKTKLIGMALLAVAAMSASAATVSVDVYTGYSASGDGTPFTGTPQSYQLAWDGNYIAPNGITGMDWHPYGLSAFGAQIKGSFSAASDGDYNFFLWSDDGSSMWIDGVKVIDNGGGHSPLQVNLDNYHLSAGTHSIQINFFEDFGGESALTAYIDERLAPVPEASTYLTGLGALGMLGMFSWRSRKQ